MSILYDHHMIPRMFAGHEALSEFAIEAARNRIYLPADSQLAANMGLSPHSGGHLGAYYAGVRTILDRFKGIMDPAERASNLNDLVDAMRVALANGHLYANVPAGMRQDEVDSKNKDFFGNWRAYADAHKDQIEAVRALREQGVRSQQPGLVKWSAIINDPLRVRQLKDAIKRNRSVNITSGNQDLRGTPFAKFAAIDPIPDLPESAPLNPNELPPLPGRRPETDTFRIPDFSPPPTIPPLPDRPPASPLPQLPVSAPPQTGLEGPQTLIRSPAQIISDDFAAASQAILNGTFTAPREPGLGSGDAVFGLLPFILAAAPEVAAGLAAARVPAVLARAAAGVGLVGAAAPVGATDAPASSPTPNQIIADDFQSLERASGGSPLTPLDRSEPDAQPFATRADSPMAPATDEGNANTNNVGSQRRVSDLTDEINGGPGRVMQVPATVNRAAQLAWLPDGGINLGQRTPFPPPVVSSDFSNLPAVLRGIEIGSSPDDRGQANQVRTDSPMAPAIDDSNSENENQRRVSGQTDEINGGPGPLIRIPATLNRAAQLAGLPYGGINFGQRTPFPPAVASSDFSNLPAVLRGTLGQQTPFPPALLGADLSGLPAVLRGLMQAPAQTPTNNQIVNWQQFDPLRLPSDYMSW